jgi:DNA-binding GntR family transcriptional regulator
VPDLVEAIRGRIVDGGLEPGQRLTEESLAAGFGVSRIPVREALRVLASEGFVRSEHYGRTSVATLDTEAAHDLLDVRAVLEPLAAAQAARRGTPEHLETFQRLLQEANGPSASAATTIPAPSRCSSTSNRDPARAATAAVANIDAAYASQHWRRVVDVRFEAAGH